MICSALADPSPGSTACVRHDLPAFADLEPRLITLSAREGEITFIEDFGTDVGSETVAQFHRSVAARLVEQASCRVHLDTSWGPLVGFGVRLSSGTSYPFAAFLCDAFPALLEQTRTTEVEIAARVCSAATWALWRYQGREAELRARTAQLEAAAESLRASHSRHLAEAIEEHEERFRERQESEQELKRLHACNQLILDSAGEGIVGLDSHGRITFVNPAVERLIGWRTDQLVGESLHQLVHHTRANREPYGWPDCPVHKTLVEGTPQHVQHDIFWRQDGTNCPVAYVATPMLEGREIVGAVLTFQDITEQRVLEGQLLQAQKLESIGQLAAGIAHEINTPTQFIGDNLRFLEDAFSDLQSVLLGHCQLGQQAGDANGLLADLAVAVQAVDLEFLTQEIPLAISQSLEGVGRVANIVRSMKEFSHPGNDEMQSVDLNRALESTLTVCRNEWKYVAEVVTDLDPELPLVCCLPGACNQVFLNLIINAAHAIADKPGENAAGQEKITVTTRADGEWVEVRVSDTGTGIPDEYRGKVFDPFFTTKEVGRGTGQGLAIARSVLTDKHGGTLSFETEMGCGTTFIVRLPRWPQRPPGEGNSK